MGKLGIGLYDVFDGFQMAEFPVAADVYDSHLRGVQEAEQMGYKYYFSIEHQSSSVSLRSMHRRLNRYCWCSGSDD